MSLQQILNNRKKAAGKKRNKYSAKESGSFSGSFSTPFSGKPRRKIKINPGTLFGVFSIAGIVAVCVVFFVIIAAGLIFLYRACTTSQYFELKNVEVQGIDHVPYSEILEKAGLAPGNNTLAVSLDEVEHKLTNNLWIEKVSVKRVLPDEIHIEVKERDPKFWMLDNGVMYYADEAGKKIAPVESNNFLPLPMLEVSKEGYYVGPQITEAVFAIEEVLKEMPPEYSKAFLYRIGEANGVEVLLEGKKLRICLGLDDLKANVQRATLVLGDLKKRSELDDALEIRAYAGRVWVIGKKAISD